jgi:hypothetical protein
MLSIGSLPDSLKREPLRGLVLSFHHPASKARFPAKPTSQLQVLDFKFRNYWPESMLFVTFCVFSEEIPILTSIFAC